MSEKRPPQPPIVSDLDFDPATAMIGQAPIAGEPLIVDGQTRLAAPVIDQLTVTQRLRDSFGDQVRDGDQPYWLRNAQQWENIEMMDRGDQFLDTNDGAYIPLRAGHPKRNGDLILGFIPAEVWERQQREEQEAMRRYVEDMSARRPQMDVQNRSFSRRAEDLERRHDEELRRNQEAGLTGPGSPTSGMSMRQAYERYDDAHIADEEATYRSGGQRRPLSPEQEEARERRVSANEGRAGRQVSMADSGFARNPNSALSQAQRRGR